MDEASGEGAPRPIAPTKPDTIVSRNPFPYNKNDAASSDIGRDDVPEKSPQQVQDFLRQRQSDWDFQDREEMIENETERLYQLMIQEGKIATPDPKAAVSDPEYKNIDYDRIARYVRSGRVPEDEKFKNDLVDIARRDSQGEWESSYAIGKPIPKKNPQP